MNSCRNGKPVDGVESSVTVNPETQKRERRLKAFLEDLNDWKMEDTDREDVRVVNIKDFMMTIIVRSVGIDLIRFLESNLNFSGDWEAYPTIEQQFPRIKILLWI